MDLAGPGLSPEAAERLLRWMAAVREANRHMNLTAINDEDAFVRDHLLDALAALPLLPAGGSVCDVGSGAGFPGVPIGVARPALRVTLLESSRRKAVFLAGSGLPVVCARAEDYGRGAGRDLYDVAVSRAAAPLAVALELVLPLVRPGGQAILWLGRPTEDEEAVVARVCGQLGAREARVVASPLPGRRFRVVDKSVATPPRYPRRPGVAARRPL